MIPPSCHAFAIFFQGLVVVGCQLSPTTEQGEALATETREPLGISSREHKVLLDPARFSGDAVAALGALNARVVALVADELEREHEGSLGELDKARRVRFYDVPGSCALHLGDFALRERVDGAKAEVMLKFRSPDRYLAMDADVAPASGFDSETKLEEDITPPYQIFFSRSSTIELGKELALERFDQAVDLFPGLQPVAPLRSSLSVVGGLEVDERVYGELHVDLGKLEADLEVSLWYLDQAPDVPKVAELSFKYKSESESYDPESVRRAMKLFDGLQHLDGWIATSSITKTAFVYGYDASFCDPAK
jgi:hypothetical protein